MKNSPPALKRLASFFSLAPMDGTGDWADSGQQMGTNSASSWTGAFRVSSAAIGYYPVARSRSRTGRMAQRVLFGESAADQPLSVMLTAARGALTQVALSLWRSFPGMPMP
jgi:hypothetical protein